MSIMGNTTNRNTGNKVLSLIGNLVLTIAFAGVCILFVLWVLGIEPKIVASGSMEPKIKVGSLCFVNTRTDYDKIEKGDIIAYYSKDGTQVTHRVTEKTLNGLVTKGDANHVNDGIAVTPENYIGKTTLSIPYLGYVFAFLQTMTGKLVVIGCVLLLVVIQFVRTFKASERYRNRQMRIPQSDMAYARPYVKPGR